MLFLLSLVCDVYKQLCSSYLLQLNLKFVKYTLVSDNHPVGRAMTLSSLERGFRGSNLEPVKLDMVRHSCNISSKEAVLPGHNDAEMGLANSLHALVQYSENNKRFDLDLIHYLVVQEIKSHPKTHIYYAPALIQCRHMLKPKTLKIGIHSFPT